MKQIKVTVNNDGSKVDIDVEGFTGSSCIETTAQMIRALGGGESKLKDEYYINNTDEVILNV